MKSNTLHLRQVILCFVFTFCIGTLFGQASSLGITMQDAFFPTQFNSGGDFFNQGSTELGMWANIGAKQTVAWRDFKTTGDNSGNSARSLQIGDEFSITVYCTRASGQIGFSLNASGTQGASYANNVSGSKLRINTDNYGSWYITNGSTATSFNYTPSQSVPKDYTFKVKILSPTLVTASLYVNGGFHSAVQNFSLLNSNPITSFSIYGSDMWDGNSYDDAYWKSCSVSSTASVELGYALASGGNLTPGSISDGLAANSNSTSVTNEVFIGGDSGSSVIFNTGCTYTGLTTINTNATLRISSNQSLANLIINSGGTVLIDANINLTLTGNIVNNGTLTIENGATLVQTGTGANANSGAGTYSMKQALTSGRYWYLGSPMGGESGYSEDLLFDQLSAGDILKKRDEPNVQWLTLANGSTTPMRAGRGYNLYKNVTSELNFTGTGSGFKFNNGDITTENLTSTGASYTGYNLVCNPYPSYLDWNAVTKTNIGTTMWYRTNDGSNMVFGTVNNNVGTTIGGVVLTRYIPPMQAFWVLVTTPGTPASLTMNNSMRSNFIAEGSSTAGLKSTLTEMPFFLRMNLEKDGKRDQLIIYTHELAINGIDERDASKMMLPGYPQLYTMVQEEKTVINALTTNKEKHALPIVMELPTSGNYHIEIENLAMISGWVWLEDMQEGIIQELHENDVYTFSSDAGTFANRFVVHFHLNDPIVPPSPVIATTLSDLSEESTVFAGNDGELLISIQDVLNVESKIVIHDATGKLVYSGVTSSPETNVKLKDAKGIYYVSIHSQNAVEVKKVYIN